MKKTYEGSKLDEKMDKKEAKKNKMSVKAWEKSSMDKKMDTKGQKKMDMKTKKR